MHKIDKKWQSAIISSHDFIFNSQLTRRDRGRNNKIGSNEEA